MIERNTVEATFHFCPYCESIKVDFDDFRGWSCKACKSVGFEPIKRTGKIVYYW